MAWVMGDWGYILSAVWRLTKFVLMWLMNPWSISYVAEIKRAQEIYFARQDNLVRRRHIAPLRSI
jgi:hypothetical protein